MSSYTRSDTKKKISGLNIHEIIQYTIIMIIVPESEINLNQNVEFGVSSKIVVLWVLNKIKWLKGKDFARKKFMEKKKGRSEIILIHYIVISITESKVFSVNANTIHAYYRWNITSR